MTAPRPHPWWLTLALAVAHGVLLVLAFETSLLWAAILLVPAVATWLALRASSTRRAVLVTVAVQTLAWLWLDRWIIPVTVLGYPLLALYMAVYAGLFVLLIRRLGSGRLGARLPMAVLVPVVWIGVECLRGELVFHGYPWFQVAHPMVEWTLFAQSADLGGTYFVGFLVASFSGALVDIALERADRRACRWARPAGVAVLVLSAANLLYGVARVRGVAKATDGPHVVVIQTNLAQDNKIGWSRERQAEDVPHFIEMTREAVRDASPPADLVVWPETMLPGVGLEAETIDVLAPFGEEARPLYRWGIEVAELSRALDVPMLVGSPVWLGAKPVRTEDGRYRIERDTEYNSAYLIAGEPPFARYDKVFLTPFGETLPYISAWPALEERLMSLGAGGMSFALDASPDIRRLDLEWAGGTMTFATPICFEDTVAHAVRRMVWEDGRKKAEALINLSNDGWFGDHGPGRRQHAQIARYRCIENRVPMIRAANTGLSVLIDSGGNLRTVIGKGRYGTGQREGVLEATLPLDPRPTLYGRIGDVWAWACLAATLMLTALAFWTARQEPTE